MKKIFFTFLFLGIFYTNTANAFYCNSADGSPIYSDGTTDIKVTVDSRFVESSFETINEYANLSNMIICYNQAIETYSDYLDMLSFSSTKFNQNVEFGVKINGTNYFNSLTQKVNVFSLVKGGVANKALDLGLILKVKNTPKNGVLISKGQPLLQMNMRKYAYYHPSNQTLDYVDYTWRIIADNDIILTSGTCDINDNQEIVVDLGQLFTSQIPSTSGTMSSGKDVPITYTCDDQTLTTPIKMYINASVSSFSPYAILAREGQAFGSGTVIQNLGVEIYKKGETVPMQPNVEKGGFSSIIKDGKGSDTLYIAPIRDPDNPTLSEGYFNSTATLIMTSP